MKRDYRVYVDDILEAIGKIEEYVQGLTFDKFAQDARTVDAVIRNFEIIGEATKYKTKEIRKEHSNVPWNDMAGMRDKLIHEYFGVKLETVWKTIKKRLPEVKPLIKEVLEEMDKEISEED